MQSLFCCVVWRVFEWWTGVLIVSVFAVPLIIAHHLKTGCFLTFTGTSFRPDHSSHLVHVCVCVCVLLVVCHPCRLAVLRGNGVSSSSSSSPQQAGEEGSGQDSGQGRQEEEAHW